MRREARKPIEIQRWRHSDEP